MSRNSTTDDGWPVTDQQGQRIQLGRAGVQVVDLLPVDLGDELRNLIESGFLCSPVEVLPPVSGQLLEVGQGHATREISASVRRGIGQRVASSLRWRSCSSASVISILNGWGAVAVVCSPR